MSQRKIGTNGQKQITSCHTLNFMLQQPDLPLTVENFVLYAWFGEKELADLEGEDWCLVSDFEQAMEELRGE
jgi:hypothetical protein